MLCAMVSLVFVSSVVRAQGNPPPLSPHEVCDTRLRDAGISTATEPLQTPLACQSDEGTVFYRAGWRRGVFQANFAFNSFSGCGGWEHFKSMIITDALPKLPAAVAAPETGLCRFTGYYDGAAGRYSELAACCGQEGDCCTTSQTAATMGQYVYCQIMVATIGRQPPHRYSLPRLQPSHCGGERCQSRLDELIWEDKACQLYVGEAFADVHDQYVVSVCGEVGPSAE